MTTPLLMTPARRITLALGVPAALIAIGWTGFVAVAWASQATYPVRYSIPVRSGPVSVSVGDGTVSVRPGTGNRVTVAGTVHYALVRPKVSVRSTQSGVAVDSSCPAFAVSCSSDFAVTVPTGHGADISVSSGDLTATGLGGPITLSAQSGNVRMAGLAGDIRIKNQSGDITGSALSGPAAVVQDQSGNISITSLAVQDVSVSDQSGDITLDFAVVPRRVVVTGLSGNITLVLPPGSTAYRLTAHTSSGNLNTRVPTSPGSSHVITVTTQSGDITVIH